MSIRTKIKTIISKWQQHGQDDEKLKKRRFNLMNCNGKKRATEVQSEDFFLSLKKP